MTNVGNLGRVPGKHQQLVHVTNTAGLDISASPVVQFFNNHGVAVRVSAVKMVTPAGVDWSGGGANETDVAAVASSGSTVASDLATINDVGVNFAANEVGTIWSETADDPTTIQDGDVLELTFSEGAATAVDAPQGTIIIFEYYVGPSDV